MYPSCVFCSDKAVSVFASGSSRLKRFFFRCNRCGGVFLSPEFYLTQEAQMARYRQHQNTLEHTGYVSFLLDFIEAVFSFLYRQTPVVSDISRILDFGSGPSPVLCQLLRYMSKLQRQEFVAEKLDGVLHQRVLKLCRSGIVLPAGEYIQGWDLFFQNTGVIPAEADVILCLEVAEHFEHPRKSFADLAASAVPGAFIAVETLPLPDDMSYPDGFNSWWYKDDRTHVSFYTEPAAELCGKSAGLVYVGKASSRIFMFRKPE